jgi:hypothetical protein
MIRPSQEIQTELYSLRSRIKTAEAAAERERETSEEQIDDLKSQEERLRQEYNVAVENESKVMQRIARKISKKYRRCCKSWRSNKK